MAYENEKNRIISEISSAVGFSRTRDSALEREATERAFEARQQTGLTYDGPQDIIEHPSADERTQRLGVPSTVATSELATWNYLYADPIGGAIEGLLESAPHRSVLENEFYDHWGIGIYTEMPDDQTNEIHRRWWIVIWLSNVEVGSQTELKPEIMFNQSRPVWFNKGTHTGYKFGFDGSVLESKTVSPNRLKKSTAKGSGNVPGKSGEWLLIDGRFLGGYWVKRHGFLSLSGGS